MTILAIGGCVVAILLGVALVIALAVLRKDHGYLDEAFAKVLATSQDNVRLKLDLAQVTANRDNLKTELQAAIDAEKRATIAKELAEGHRNELLDAAPGTAVAKRINDDLRALKDLSPK